MSQNRRRFLRSSVAAGVAAPFVSRLSWAQASPTQRVQHIGVGVGGKGWTDIHQVSDHDAAVLVAGADIDTSLKARLAKSKPDAKFYQDWREMFEKEDFDSVSVSTPDHMHGIVGLTAIKRGKHVYGQKPLAGRVKECRILAEEAKKASVVTQMGNQMASSLQERLGIELLRMGAVGKIKEVHVFSHKNWGDANPIPEGSDPVPETLDWEGYVAVSPMRPFKKGVYHPGNWRRRQDFGTGCLGDMGCHIFNPFYRGLQLGPPISVKSSSGVTNADCWAPKEEVRYIFPGSELTEGKTLNVTWYSGAIQPPADAWGEIPENRRPKQGTLYVGEKGKILVPHGSTTSLWNPEDFKGFKYPRIEPRDHYREYVDCILGKQKEAPISNFSYAGPTTESILLGCVASIFPGQELEWDAENCRVANLEEANAHIEPRARGDWKLPV